MAMSLTRKILRLIEKASPEYPLDEIEKASRTLWEFYQEKKGHAAAKAALTFEPGDLVLSPRCGRRMPEGVVGEVKQIRRLYVRVDFGTYGSWRILGSDLKPAPKGTKFKFKGRSLEAKGKAMGFGSKFEERD